MKSSSTVPYKGISYKTILRELQALKAPKFLSLAVCPYWVLKTVYKAYLHTETSQLLLLLLSFQCTGLSDHQISMRFSIGLYQG